MTALRDKAFAILPWAVILAGCALRLIQYLWGRCLWYDEAMVALNILNRSAVELFKPLDFDQAAPVGWLLLVKATTTVFGSSEFALRAPSLLFGTALLPLLFLGTKALLGRRAALYATCIIAFTPAAVYYSSELKPYISDAFLAMLAIVLSIHQCDRFLTSSRAAQLAVFGCIAVWVSYPIVYVLAGVGTALMLLSLRARAYRQFGMLLVISIGWLTSFAACYFLTMRTYQKNAFLVQFWESGFMPASPYPAVNWLYWSLIRVFQDPLGVDFPGLAACLALVGGVGLVKEGKRDVLFVLTLPILFAIGGACAARYPFKSRLILFLLPLLAILVANGVDALRLRNDASSSKGNVVVASIMMFFLVFNLIVADLKEPTRYRNKVEEIGDVLKYLEGNAQPGDHVWVPEYSYPAFTYYRGRFVFHSLDVVTTKAERARLRQEVTNTRKQHPTIRVWFVFSHNPERSGVSREEQALRPLLERGNEVLHYEADGAWCYLVTFP
jgi:4-amino-4-deoxy-L-arabinose transferase-like glycosyltransferase